MPIRTHDTIKALTAALAGDATIQQQVPTGVYSHRLPAPPSDEVWSRIVVRELKVELRQRDGFLLLPVQVMVEVRGVADPDLLLQATHERAEEVLSQLAVDTAFGKSLIKPERYTRPTAVIWSEEAQSYASSATYLIPLKDA